ncbi:MAG: MFS transporter [Candidatus Promineifilaceae bacterium]|jgi:MFS family permease
MSEDSEKAPSISKRRLPRNIWVLTLVSFFTDISSEMILHLIPLFLANVLGVRTITIGFIEGVAETTTSLVKIISGRYSDRLGRRKWLTVAGYGLSTVAKPFLILANTWQSVFAVRFTERIGKGIRTAPRDALIADSISEDKRGLAFGVQRAGDTAGATLGILIAIGVVWLAQGTALTLSRETFHTLVWLSLVPAVLAVVFLIVGIQEDKTRPSSDQGSGIKGGLPAPFRHYLIVVVIFTLGNSSDAFLLLRAQDQGVNILGVLGLLLLLNMIYTAVSGPAGSLSDRIGRKRLLTAGWSLYALVYLGFALLGATWQLIFFFALYGLYYGLTEGVAKAYVADLAPGNVRGTAYGWFNAAVGLAALPASLLAGLLWQGVGGWSGLGAAAPFLFGAVLAVLAILLLVTWLPPDTA